MALTGPHGGVLSNLYPDAVARDAQRKTLQALRASGRARGQLRDADMLLGEALFPLKGFLGRAARACAPGPRRRHIRRHQDPYEVQQKPEMIKNAK